MVGEQPPWSQGENAALALRHRLHRGDAPVNIWDVIRQMDLALALHDFGPDGGDGMYILKGGRPLIIVNTERRPSKQRFTAAHELGHHEMHRHEQKNLVIADRDVDDTGKVPAETAANSFAATLLAPDGGLKSVLGRKRNKLITPEDVIELVGVFGMSYEATCFRLNSAGLVQRPVMMDLLGVGGVEYLIAQAELDEGALFPPRHPLPSSYADEVARLWRNRLIRDERFAEMLRIREDEADAWRQQRGITRPEMPEHDEDLAARLRAELA